jgi:hypothetical protein
MGSQAKVACDRNFWFIYYTSRAWLVPSFGRNWTLQPHISPELIENRITAVPTNNDTAALFCREIPKADMERSNLTSPLPCPLKMVKEKTFDQEIRQEIIPSFAPESKSDIHGLIPTYIHCLNCTVQATSAKSHFSCQVADFLRLF